MRRLSTLFNEGVTGAVSDGQLLERFATRRGESAEQAFEALVDRHGPMVLRACRGILRDAAEVKPFATLRAPTPVIARVFVDAKWTDKPVLQLDDPFWDSVRFLLPAEPKPAG